MSGIAQPLNIYVDGTLTSTNTTTPVPIVTAVENALTTIPVTKSGVTVIVPQSTHAVVQGGVNTILLPNPTVVTGFRVKVIFKAVGDGNAAHNWAITSSGANMIGVDYFLGGAANTCGVAQHAASTNLLRNGTAATAIQNDYVDLVSDGTNWYFSAYSSGNASPYTVS